MAPVCFLETSDLIGVRTVTAMGCQEMPLEKAPGPYSDDVCSKGEFSDYEKR